MFFGYFTLLVAVLLSSIGAYFSVLGLTSIFTSSVWAIIIMGGSLELGKITAAVWLKRHWHQCTLTFKALLIPVVAGLMLLTSIGIYGVLSKSHSSQSKDIDDAVAKVTLINEQIAIEKENIETYRKSLLQLNTAFDQTISRSTSESSISKAVSIRKNQQQERNKLNAEITASQNRITKLNEERAPLETEMRAVQSETGPIRYIAAVIYGDSPSNNSIEQAVRLIINLIVVIFDPLAIMLMLAAQQSLKWAQEDSVKKQAVIPESIDNKQPTDQTPPEDIPPTLPNDPALDVSVVDPEVEPISIHDIEIIETPSILEPVKAEIIELDDLPCPNNESIADLTPNLPEPFANGCDIVVESTNINTSVEVPTVISYTDTAVTTEGDLTGNVEDIQQAVDDLSEKKRYMIKEAGRQLVKLK